MIRIRDLSFGYTANSEVLNIASLDIQSGERIFLHGPSGSGKSTFLGLLAGIHVARRGTVEIAGTDLKALRPEGRDRFRGSRLGYVFQAFNLIPYLNVAENIRLPCLLNAERRARLGGADLNAATAELARHLRIEEFLHVPVTSLSVGQQQRVACARALLGAPSLVIADEPTSALDTDHRERFLKLLFNECEKVGTTLVFVSHDRGLETQFTRSVSLNEINRAQRPISRDEDLA